MEVQDQLEGQDGLTGEVLESVGEPKELAGEIDEGHSSDAGGAEGSTDPFFVQKRLKQQKRAHDREMREMRAEFQAQMQSLNQNQGYQQQAEPMNPYDGGMQPAPVDEQIRQAVSYALQHKDMQERKAKEAEQAQHVHQQYEGLNRHLDRMNDKYDDFDDIVRGDTPYTNHMRDAALILPKTGPGSAGEVLYQLGKKPEELSRIAKLHPMDQVSELVKLSNALIAGPEQKGSVPKTLGNIKSNPVTNSLGITDKTPISELRKRMRSNWK